MSSFSLYVLIIMILLQIFNKLKPILMKSDYSITYMDILSPLPGILSRVFVLVSAFYYWSEK